MVRAAMAELQLVRLAAHRERQDLMTEADAEDRNVGVHERVRVVDRVPQRRGIAGPLLGTRHRVPARAGPPRARSPEIHERRSRTR